MSPTIAERRLDILDERGAPDLQKLIRIFGGYDKIPASAWAQWDADNVEYQKLLRQRARGTAP